MFLSDREITYAIQSGRLIIKPASKIGPTSIDLHLDTVDQAKIWDIKKFQQHNEQHGHPAREFCVGRMEYAKMSELYHIAPPQKGDDPEVRVWRRDKQIIIKPLGFVLWQTKEVVGTPSSEPDLILFINGRSTRTARTGLVVHLTAPTIHAGWSGNVTLEMANLGPFDIVLQEGDAIAQLTVATVSSIPRVNMQEFGSTTFGQTNVGGTKA